MFKTLITILRENWQWRGQIRRLAVFDLIKKSRGAVFSWAWLFIKPLIYIFVFWFALDIGLRAGRDMDPPFFLWLVAGLVPWFFMQEMLNAGSDVLHRYSYLANKIKFPISGIPTIFGISTLIVHLGLVVVLLIIFFAAGIPLDLFLIQVPFIIITMFLFFLMYSLTTSLLCALSKDFANLIKAIVTPLFWLSGVLYDPTTITILWVKRFLLFNPITFFATAYRDAFYTKTWIWDDLHRLGAFGVVFLATFITMLLLYKRLSKEVPDVL